MRIVGLFVLVTFMFVSTKWASTSVLIEESLFVFGMVLVGIGAAGRIWATLFIAAQKPDQLLTTGPYSLCRNPLYFFSLILGIGIGFCTETLTMPLIVGSVLFLLYHFQINREEEILSSAFGAEYQGYVAAVPRFFPTGKPYSAPNEISVSLKRMKTGLLETASSPMLIGAIEMLEMLHQSGMVPVLIQVY